MKLLIFLSVLFCAIALPALGELTDADLDKIRLIVNDSEKRMRLIVDASEKRIREEMKAAIAKSEKNIKEYIDLKTDSVEKRLSTYGWVIYVLMPLIVVGMGVPTTIRGMADWKGSLTRKTG